MSSEPLLPPGYVLHAFDRLESTNDEARRLAQQGADAGVVVVAEQQLKGRGRHGRVWHSPPGNLYASVLLRPECTIAVSAQLSLVASLALVTVAGALGRAAAEAPPPTDPTAFVYHRAVLEEGIGGVAGCVLTMIFCLALLGPSCYAPTVFRARFAEALPLQAMRRPFARSLRIVLRLPCFSEARKSSKLR